MDASCKIQRSIHDVRLTYKYVSRILGTYQFQGCCKKITSVISLADKKYSVVIVNTDIQTRHD